MAENFETDKVTGQQTTGHEWDGIKELNTPLPRWWLHSWYVTIAASLVYMFLYPALPFIGEKGYSAGFLNHSDRDAVVLEIKDAAREQAHYYEKLDQLSLSEIETDPELLAFARRGGAAAFGDNCVPCHGTAGQGFKGFPSLQDDDWLWGGDLTAIDYTVRHGIRYEQDEDTRRSSMPRFFDDGLLSREQILLLVDYVSHLSDEGYEPQVEHFSTEMTEAQGLFMEKCASCHGANGEGTRAKGAPRLNDAIWLYGGDRQSLYDTIAHARFGVMPAWGQRLDARVIKQLSLYVHGLGGGEYPAEP